MDRRAFLRLVGLGVALGPEAIAEAMKPQVFYSIPASLGVTESFIPWRYMYGRIHLSAQQMDAYDHVLRTAYNGQVHELTRLRLRRDLTRQIYA